MTDPLQIKIKVGPTGNSPGNRIEVDGHDLTNHIRGFTIDSTVNDLTSLRLDFVNVEVELDGAVDLTAMGNEWATYRLGKIMRDEMQEGEKAHG